MNEPYSGASWDVLEVLIQEGRFDAVLAAFKALLKENEKLEQTLAELVERRRSKANEGVSSDQLSLFVKRLREQAAAAEPEPASSLTPELDEANRRLAARADAAAERTREKVLSAGPGSPNKPLKKPLPAHSVTSSRRSSSWSRPSSTCVETFAKRCVVITATIIWPEYHGAKRSRRVGRSAAASWRRCSMISTKWERRFIGSARTSNEWGSSSRHRPCVTRSLGELGRSNRCGARRSTRHLILCSCTSTEAVCPCRTETM